MRRIITILLLVAFIGLFLLSIGCSGSGYKGEDPKNGPAKKAGGLDSKGQPAPAPTVDGASGGPAPAPPEGTK